MGRSKQPKMGAGPLVLLCLFAVAIVAMCAVVLSWNAKHPTPSSSSTASSSSATASSSAASKSASSAASSKAASSASQKPASSSSSESAASSSSQSTDEPVANAGPNGTYLLNTEMDIRAAACVQMSADNKAAVGDNWRAATITSVVLQGAMGDISDFNYVNQEVYAVNFVCKDAKRIPPEICVYVAKDTGKVIGYGYYD